MSEPGRYRREPRAGPLAWARWTYANLRRSGLLDSVDEHKETYLCRQLVAGHLDRASYQRAMSELASRGPA